MKIRRPLLALALIAMTLPISSYADSDKHTRCHQHSGYAHGAGKFSHHGFDARGVPPHLAALNLSETQQDKIFELMHAQMPKARDAEKQRHQLTTELHKLSSSDAYAESQAKQIAEKLAVIEKERALNRAAINHQVYQMLTPEQRKQFGELKQTDAEGFSKSRFDKRHHHRAEKFERNL